ncbi:hypothetical protein GGTG_09813 [Gaeumannomyces tritici R3-111a-1]|uniref:Uncharacterized protein n=1 Tax=Gaeumannomyces tritici (strain R3-111a-1) TaxID=644352 RepID=J3P8H9_GAET3|nr:hypothetical protein GGTG_09813 [Gaeumannomyces tritici R3-111a-1]EJT72962.1 hypothetical protein GGTG_09813 [Gaeumannomyces tritici R3-111a-1]
MPRGEQTRPCYRLGARRPLGLCCRTGLAQNGQNGVWYLYPPEGGLTLYSLDTVNVSYISPFGSPNMFTFCDNGNKLIRIQPAGPKNRSVLVYLNFTSSTPCYFNLRPGMEAGFSANSPKFSLSSTPRSVMTTVGAALPANPTSSPSSSSSSSSETTASSSKGTSTANPDTPLPVDAPSESLSTRAPAGIGIGAAIGGTGLLAVAFFLGRRWRARGEAPGPATEQINPPLRELEATPTEMCAMSPPTEMPGYVPPLEMPASHGHRPQ